MIKVFFPWHPKELSPNARVHWAAKARAAKKYKTDCAWTLVEHKVGKQEGNCARLKFSFYPPDNRRRDLDNLFASSKPLIDAISDAIGIDDSKFSFSFVKWEPTKGGKVVVEIKPDWRAIKTVRVAA